MDAKMSHQTNLFNICKVIAFFLIGINSAYACTRAVYLGPKDTVITSRSMDWTTDVETNIWVFPRGLERDGAAGVNSIKWTAKYGSVVATFFEVATADGINEKGLVTSLLYLAESVYPKLGPNDKRKTISIAAWAQYVLDNFQTVNEAVEALKKEPFIVQQIMTPDGYPGVGHLAISDKSGDSAIFEYINEKLIIHHDKKYQVMTNSPTFDQQLAINNYWQDVGPEAMLPGTSRAADRFVRASYYVSVAPQTDDYLKATVYSFAIIRDASVPYGGSMPNKPNIAATLWRSVSDQKNMLYYFDSSTAPNVFWIDLNNVDFATQKDTLRLAVSGKPPYAGNATKQLAVATPFKFLSPKI
jgi:penicillin V acylase-like amidase (Ntn superfamily)